MGRFTKRSPQGQCLDELGAYTKPGLVSRRHGGKENERRLFNVTTDGSGKRGRKLRVVIRHGFEVSETTELRNLQRFRPVPPRGWCKKYWWDGPLPDYEDETGGCATVYTPDHESSVQTVNTLLGFTLADESRLRRKTDSTPKASDNEAPCSPPELELCGCIAPRHQRLRDVIQYPLDSAREFLPVSLYTSHSDAESKWIDRSTVWQYLKSKSEDEHQAESKQGASSGSTEMTCKSMVTKVAPWDRHRLKDTTLHQEFIRQQRLRKLCECRWSSLTACFKSWDNHLGLWVQRDPDYGYGKRDTI